MSELLFCCLSGRVGPEVVDGSFHPGAGLRLDPAECFVEGSVRGEQFTDDVRVGGAEVQGHGRVDPADRGGEHLDGFSDGAHPVLVPSGTVTGPGDLIEGSHLVGPRFGERVDGRRVHRDEHVEGGGAVIDRCPDGTDLAECVASGGGNVVAVNASARLGERCPVGAVTPDLGGEDVAGGQRLFVGERSNNPK
ncbi:MAG: hypothetical protein WD225_05140 [Ilumatobacteraceae bacterium]